MVRLASDSAAEAADLLYSSNGVSHKRTMTSTIIIETSDCNNFEIACNAYFYSLVKSVSNSLWSRPDYNLILLLSRLYIYM